MPRDACARCRLHPNHLDQPLAVRRAVQVAEMSQSHFSKLFKRRSCFNDYSLCKTN